ncbi:hypothetical protein PIB30_028902 [Stylosanthes scabra]|uniref:J domain-containing protein n=1 Tax=Stylosanthes scabra TaxID=79078 RepID=A0ABU6ZAW3_9FABA|nr:hypothetical protein [Stylosanthes scabra]
MSATLNLSAVPAVKFSFCSDNRACNGRFHRHSPIRAIASPVPATSGSLYEVLRVEQDASPTEIKSAFRSLAKLYHPDVAAVRRLPDSDGDSGTDDGDFIEIRNAYETLSDSSSRAMYDRSLASRKRRFQASLSVKGNSGYNSTRRWETDQCCLWPTKRIHFQCSKPSIASKKFFVWGEKVVVLIDEWAVMVELKPERDGPRGRSLSTS